MRWRVLLHAVLMVLATLAFFSGAVLFVTVPDLPWYVQAAGGFVVFAALNLLWTRWVLVPWMRRVDRPRS